MSDAVFVSMVLWRLLNSYCEIKGKMKKIQAV